MTCEVHLERQRRASTVDLRHFSAGLIALAELSPRRLTMAQCTFFVTAALADRAGRASTFTEIKEAIGPIVNRSLHTTYKAFLEQGRNQNGKRTEGLRWLEADTDPADNRRKYLRLTPEGHAVMDEVAAAVHHID